MGVATGSVAWNRINRLFDEASFRLMDDLDPTIHILGSGTLNGTFVYCCAGVPEAGRVDILECFHREINWLQNIIAKPAPVIWLHDSPPQTTGGRTPIPENSDELLASDKGVGRVFCLQARLNGKVPQFSAMFGDAGAAQTFPFRLADFTLIKDGTHIWIGRPDAVKLMLGKAPDAEELGGAKMHCTVSGVGDVFFREDSEALDWIRRCMRLLPQCTGAALPVSESREPELSCAELLKVVPDDLNKPFDMKKVLLSLIDAGSFVEYQELYAREAFTGLAKIEGSTVGIIANNSIHKGGVIFPESCRKMTRFIKFCDTYKVPMIFLVDNPGLMVGVRTEQGGMLAEASELLRTLAVTETPRACFVIRKAYTVGLYAMSGPGFDPTCFWAAPRASISVFGPKALDSFAADRDLPPRAVKAINEMLHHALDPHDYERKGYLDSVIEWRDIRSTLISFVR